MAMGTKTEKMPLYAKLDKDTYDYIEDLKEEFATKLGVKVDIPFVINKLTAFYRARQKQGKQRR